MVLISLISLRRLLRQRRFVSFRLLFLATTQRVSRCSLPSLRGRGWGEGHFYVFYYLCHYGFCIILSVIWASASLLLCLLHTQPLMSLCHSGFCLLVTLSLHTLSIMSFWLPFLCYHVFYILSPFGHYVFCSSVTMSLHTQPLMSLCHSGFINVKYFY